MLVLFIVIQFMSYFKEEHWIEFSASISKVKYLQFEYFEYNYSWDMFYNYLWNLFKKIKWKKGSGKSIKTKNHCHAPIKILEGINYALVLV